MTRSCLDHIGSIMVVSWSLPHKSVCTSPTPSTCYTCSILIIHFSLSRMDVKTSKVYRKKTKVIVFPEWGEVLVVTERDYFCQVVKKKTTNPKKCDNWSWIHGERFDHLVGKKKKHQTWVRTYKEQDRSPLRFVSLLFVLEWVPFKTGHSPNGTHNLLNCENDKFE